MKTGKFYVAMCIVGTALPYWQFIPWLATHGLNLPLFFHDLFANRVSAFFAMDVIVSAVTLMVFVRTGKPGLTGISRWLPPIAVLTVGVSLALPLFLFLRERQRSQASAS